MTKIFYKPETLQIMGMSDGEIVMGFPYIETEQIFHSLENVHVEKVDDIYVLKITNNYPNT